MNLPHLALGWFSFGYAWLDAELKRIELLFPGLDIQVSYATGEFWENTPVVEGKGWWR